MNYIVYQSYGKTDILNECRYSILSLLKQGLNFDKTKIVVYTDQKDYFSFLPSKHISFIDLTADDIQKYSGPHSFVFRPKIKVLQDAASRFDGKIIYADSDIYFLKPIESLFDMIDDSNYILCNNEGAMRTKGNRVFDKFSRFIDSNKSYLEEHGVAFPQDLNMWNAGVIGFTTSNKDKVDKVLNTCDVILERFYSHVIEQLAFSFVFQGSGKVKAATDFVFHYWNLKEFRSVLAEFFEYHLSKSTVDDMINDVDSIRPDVMIKPKMQYESLPFIHKTLAKMKGRENRWKFPEYSFGKSK